MGVFCVVLDELHLQTDVANGKRSVAVVIQQIATVHSRYRTNIDRKNSMEVGSFVVSL